MNLPIRAKISAKYKTYAAAVVWVVLCALMFSYFFGILDTSNQRLVAEIGSEKITLTQLQDERDSYIKAQADLAKMNLQTIQPQNLFSKDITLVKEIIVLENWAHTLNVTVSLSGLSGTIKTTPKAPTLTEIFTLPYTISVSGAFPQVMNFVEVLENLGFITNVNTVVFSSDTGNNINAVLTTSFYLKK